MNSIRTNQPRHSNGLIAVLCISVMLAAPAAHAAWPDTSAFEDARQLSDRELSAQRGKFIKGDKVVYFGVEMSSRWKTAAGEMLHAEAEFHADVSGSQPEVRFKPTVSVSTDDSRDMEQAESSDIAISNKGMNNSSGVTQTIQVGGENNAVANDAVIEITDNSSATATALEEQADMNNQIDNRADALTTQSGASLSVSRSGDSMGVSINTPNGRVKQQIKSSQGLKQMVQLKSNLQQVRNMTRLRVQLQRQTGRNLDMPRRALKSLARNLRSGF